ncbi:MAG: methyltransferase domain-containing protein [Henriciella sp.]|nr:methyltransferase domain-containing protein [Henriciella sp.]
MSLFETVAKTAGRARYTAAQSLRSAWYGGQYALARRRSAGFNRPGEPVFRPQNKPEVKALRKAYFDLFRRDRANIEAGLYPDPMVQDMRVRDFPGAVKRARSFLKDVAEVDRRRLDRDGTEVRGHEAADPKRFPAYYRQNFHYQTDGWLSDESAAIYDHQVEALFTGAADAMRRGSLAELARELEGRDQRQTSVLDLACGAGRFMRQTLNAFPRLSLTGLDLSPPYARAARQAVARWPQADVVEGQAEALPFEDASFDAIVSIYLFHELPPRVRGPVIDEAARVLKPGGALIVADSLQFGDNPGLDGFLEYFPEGFHEPYYKGYLNWDFEPAMRAVGMTAQRTQLAFLTKVKVWRKAR